MGLRTLKLRHRQPPFHLTLIFLCPGTIITQNSIKLAYLPKACHRYNVSNTTGADIVIETLINFGLISANDASFVIKRSNLEDT